MHQADTRPSTHDEMMDAAQNRESHRLHKVQVSACVCFCQVQQHNTLQQICYCDHPAASLSCIDTKRHSAPWVTQL